MTAHTNPIRTDWRDHVRGLPIAAISEEGIKPLSTGEDAMAQRAIEHVAASDRKQTKRGESA